MDEKYKNTKKQFLDSWWSHINEIKNLYWTTTTKKDNDKVKAYVKQGHELVKEIAEKSDLK